MNSNSNSLLLRALRGPLTLILIGTLFVIDHAGMLSFTKTWPIIIIFLGVIRLGERFGIRWDQAQSNGSTVAVADGWMSDRQYLGKLGVALTTQATIRLGELQHNTAYQSALDGQRAWRRELSRVFDKVDFIALPTLKSLPPHQLLFERSALFEARVLALQNTVAVNYASNPAIAIPIPYPDRHFPVTSLQLIGPRFDEAGLVNAARIVMAESPVTLEKRRR